MRPAERSRHRRIGRLVAEEDPLVIENMRGRAAQCRRLANAILDRRAAETLLKMAEEIEADIQRLEGGEPAGK